MSPIHSTTVESCVSRFGAKCLVLAVTVVSSMMLLAAPVHAIQVDPFPSESMVENPWFRNAYDSSKSGLDGWTTDTEKNTNGLLLWSTSQKGTEPTPDNITSGVCRGADYCGTSARFSDGSGQGGYGSGLSGADAYLYQVVEANPNDLVLTFKTHWVTGWIEVAEATIYQGETAEGPWTPVWTPFQVDASTGSGHVWTETDVLVTELESGAPFYKVEFHGRYPAGRSQGFKFTGVYFTVTADGEPEPSPSPEPSPEPTPEPTPSPSPEPSPEPTPEPTPSPSPESSPEPTPDPNNAAPYLSTSWLFSGTVGQSYSMYVRGGDADLGDTLTMSAAGLPDGLSIGSCFTNASGTLLRHACLLNGVPTTSGVYYPEFTITDLAGASSSQVYELVIN